MSGGGQLSLIGLIPTGCRQIQNKIQALAVRKRTFDKKPLFEINDVKISCDESVNVLGVEIDYLLKFDSHISSICRKAAQQIHILKRIGKYLTKLNKLTIFHTFIVSNFN